MKEFRKDTKLAKIEAYAAGYYSGAEAFGRIYVPVDFYEEYKTLINNLGMSVSELDGKHSETDCEIDVEINTLEHFVNNYEKFDYASRDITENISEYIIDDLNEVEEQTALENAINQLTENIVHLANKTENQIITLSEDVVLENVKIPKGTFLHFLMKTPLTDETIFKINFPNYIED